MASATRDVGERGAPSTGENRDANEACEAEIVTGAGPAPGSGAFLTRRQVARRLGLSLSTVRRMEGGELKPIIDERGVRYFEATEIQAVFVRVRRTRRPDSEHADGTLAAAAFTLFQSGSDVVAVVKELREAPERIEVVFDHWKRLRGTILLDAESLRAVANHLNASALTDEKSILSAVTEFKKQTELGCVLCEQETAQFCGDCAREAGRTEMRGRDSRRLF